MRAAGWGVWRLFKGLCSQYVSILGGRALGWTLQEEQGEDSLKRNQLFSVFSDLCCMSSHPDYSPSSLLSLTDWFAGSIVVLCLTAASLSHPLISLQPIFYLNSIETRRFVFPSSSPHQSLSWKKLVRRTKGPGTRQICLAFTPHNASHLNFPIYCWSPVWMVPLMKCCFCGSSHESQRPLGDILLPSLTSKLYVRGHDGMEGRDVTRSTAGCCLPNLSHPHPFRSI